MERAPCRGSAPIPPERVRASRDGAARAWVLRGTAGGARRRAQRAAAGHDPAALVRALWRGTGRQPLGRRFAPSGAARRGAPCRWVRRAAGARAPLLLNCRCRPPAWGAGGVRSRAAPYMPERPHTTRDREKENITQSAAQPTCTMRGSPCRSQITNGGEGGGCARQCRCGARASAGAAGIPRSAFRCLQWVGCCIRQPECQGRTRATGGRYNAAPDARHCRAPHRPQPRRRGTSAIRAGSTQCHLPIALQWGRGPHEMLPIHLGDHEGLLGSLGGLGHGQGQDGGTGGDGGHGSLRRANGWA